MRSRTFDMHPAVYVRPRGGARTASKLDRLHANSRFWEPCHVTLGNHLRPVRSGRRAPQPPAGAAAGGPGAPPVPRGTPVTAPATRHAFTATGPSAGAGDSAEREPLEGRRTWRMADVVAAISGGPRARMLIEAASRPGPVEPGSLLEAVKALRPAPTLPESTRTV